MRPQSARFEKSWPPFCQIRIIFTNLKLWIASARHNFKWVKIQIELFGGERVKEDTFSTCVNLLSADSEYIRFLHFFISTLLNYQLVNMLHIKRDIN